MDFLKNTMFNKDWVRENGLAFLMAIPGAMLAYKTFEWMFDAMIGQDGEGFFGFIPKFFAAISSFGFAAMAFPSIMLWMKETAIPWLGDKATRAGELFSKTTGIGQKGAALEPALLPADAEEKSVVQRMPEADVSLASVRYDGTVGHDEAISAPSARAGAGSKTLTEAKAVPA